MPSPDQDLPDVPEPAQRTQHHHHEAAQVLDGPPGRGRVALVRTWPVLHYWCEK